MFLTWVLHLTLQVMILVLPLRERAKTDSSHPTEDKRKDMTSFTHLNYHKWKLLLKEKSSIVTANIYPMPHYD